MSDKVWFGVIVLSGALIAWFLIFQTQNSDEWFIEYPLPLTEADRLFDIGIVDANGDDFLDIYTSNHHFRQALLISDGKRGYRDVLSEWGLDQSKEFPQAELSFFAPVIDKPGLYIYWFGTQFIIRAHNIAEPRNWRGILRVNDPVDIIKNVEFLVQKQDQTSLTAETVIEFSPSSDGFLRLRPGGQGLPITFEFNHVVPPSQIYVGRGKLSPSSSSFSLAMRDRHAMAWADYNADGVQDVFINRGALGGTLRGHNSDIQQSIRDELLVTQGDGKFEDIVSSVGIEKNGCSGRHARWLDFDRDGRLDLFVNCYDRGNVNGTYPKQLYRQDGHGRFHDVAKDVGLDIPNQQIGSFGWFDVDDDGDIDVLAFADEGFFLYRNEEHEYAREPVAARTLGKAERIGYTTGSDWFYDGKLAVADFDTDGDLDVFSSSKRGNFLFVNNEGKLSSVDPISVGLPSRSVTANWVDYDNDGLPDLHLIPQGLFRQHSDQSFARTGLLDFPSDQYDAAICNWVDLDNDGRLDVVMALHENADFKRWWEFSKKPRRKSKWDLRALRNVGAENHWLQIGLVGGDGNRDGIGARVTVTTLDSRQVQEVGSSEGSFFSQGHYRLYFGLGAHATAEVIKIRWPDGHQQELNNVKGDQLIVVKRRAME